MILTRKKENILLSKKLDISYRMSSGIPFRWEYEIEDTNIVEFVSKKTVGEKTKEPICGGPITIHYYFKGKKKGNTKIIFKLVNFADNYLDKEEVYNISVDDRLNAKIVK